MHRIALVAVALALAPVALAGAGPPAPVEIVEANPVSPVAVRVAWTPSEADGFVAYEVHATIGASFTPSDETLAATFADPSEAAAVVEGLRPEATYSFLVRVLTDGGDSSSAPVTLVTPADVVRAARLRAAPAEGGGVALSWSGGASSYRVHGAPWTPSEPVAFDETTALATVSDTAFLDVPGPGWIVRSYAVESVGAAGATESSNVLLVSARSGVVTLEEAGRLFAPAPPPATIRPVGPAERVAAGASYVLSLPDDALVSIEWGDGSMDLGRSRAEHVYAEPGSYSIRVAEVDGSATGFVDVTVVEPSGSWGGTIPLVAFGVVGLAVVGAVALRHRAAAGRSAPSWDGRL